MILKVHQHILQVLTLGGQSVSCTVPRTTVATQKQYHLAQVKHVNEYLDSFHNGSNNTVLVSVLTSSAKYMI